MFVPSSRNRFILFIIIFAIVLAGAVYLSLPGWLGPVAALISLAAIIYFSIAYARSAGMARLYSRLSELDKKRDRTTSAALVGELIAATGSGKSRSAIAAELISSRFNLTRFAVFFREGDRYFPRVYSGFHPAVLGRPRASRLRIALREIESSGRLSKPDAVFAQIFRKNDWEYFESPLACFFKWGRFDSVIFAADDENGVFSESLSEDGFVESVWPFLFNYIQHDERLRESAGRNSKLQNELNAAKKDISNLTRDLNSKLLDLHSFVEISAKLYNILNEEQLFKTLKDTVRERLGVEKTEILCFEGDGRFAPHDLDDRASNNGDRLVIEADSAFYRMLIENPKPLLLPVVSSGLEDDPFVDRAVGHGFIVAAGIRVGSNMGCVLLVSEKTDKKQYSSSDIDFLSTVSNIASLSLENIRQYTTIEKLSYTDSMTGVHNYRYFYKRLIEEILRARRFSRKLALVILDIDNFKLFNDKYGHQTGDLVLKNLAGIITSTVRSIDVVSRYGGEEFCIIMPDTDVDSCAKFIERLRKEIAGLRLGSDMAADDSVVTASVGGAVYPSHASNADRLIYCADMALLKAKASGRDLAVMYRPDITDKEESSIEGKK